MIFAEEVRFELTRALRPDGFRNRWNEPLSDSSYYTVSPRGFEPLASSFGGKRSSAELRGHAKCLHCEALAKQCSGRGSNSHAFRHTILSGACLPVPPPELIQKSFLRSCFGFFRDASALNYDNSDKEFLNFPTDCRAYLR